jgi:ubiquinone/menaquinone biosynthesis C-methylase UbiE
MTLEMTFSLLSERQKEQRERMALTRTTGILCNKGDLSQCYSDEMPLEARQWDCVTFHFILHETKDKRSVSTEQRVLH